jgi:hypothetical protein
MATGIRISSQSFAQANIGGICQYNTTEGVEYGRILRVTPTEIALERLEKQEDGTFAPHPEPVCPRSRNRITYLKRKVMLVSAPATGSVPPAPVGPTAPAPKSKSKSAVSFVLGGAAGLAGELLAAVLIGK